MELGPGRADHSGGARGRCFDDRSVLMGKLSKIKGKVWEQAVALYFRTVMPKEDVRRGWQARSGADAPDVSAGPFWVECKVGARPNGSAALLQATDDAPKGRIPIAVCKRNQTAPGEVPHRYVVIGLEDFLDLVGEWWDRTGA